MNHLEQLVSEWLEIKGYLIKRNTNVGRLSHGGFECEIDIVGYHPVDKHLIQIETSIDAHSWEMRESRFKKKLMLVKNMSLQRRYFLDFPKTVNLINGLFDGETMYIIQ